LKRILLGQLNSNGDCLYATVIARQIKEVDYPGCHLTWAVNQKCKQSILLNPYVDEIWEVSTKSSLTTVEEWENFTAEAEHRKKKGEFDEIFYTQIIGRNTLVFDGGIRSTIYNAYPHPITVSHQPIIKLSNSETDRVKQFAIQHNLESYKHVILMECGPDSFVSSLNPGSAYRLAENVITKHDDVAIILSSNKRIDSRSARIIDGSVLSFRENAELTHYCTLFIGCSSGISWLTTTTQAKHLPKVILIDYSSFYTPSMVYDLEYCKLSTEDIIEVHENKNSLAELEDCTELIINNDFKKAKTLYHIPFKLGNYKYIYRLIQRSFAAWDFYTPFVALKGTFKRNGFDIKALGYFLKGYVKLPVYVIQNAFKKKNR
jgi:ADP-heptose:LPS heptosyltransferase